MRRVIIALGLCAVTWVPASGATLYVNNSGSPACSDATAKASNAAGSPWCSIGRAAWGSTTRSSPNTSEAAAAGDTVLVTGGTYSSAETTADNWAVLYNPANSGSVGNYITFTCVGACTLVAEGGAYAAIGADTRDYIKWYADVTLGYAWSIQACALTTAPTGCPDDFVLPDQGLGPVLCHDVTACWIEGVTIDGGPNIDWADNYNGVRAEFCASCTFRNLTIRDFRLSGGNHNQSCVTFYGVANGVSEYVTCSNAGSGIFFKDTGITPEQSGNRVRYWLIDTVNEGIAFSQTSEDRNYIYQNIITNVEYGFKVVGGGNSNDWIFNNVFYAMSSGCVGHNAAGSGARFWNNICLSSTADMVDITGGANMPADTVLDHEHNVYSDYATTFYSGTTTRTFANYKSTYTDQDQATPASVDADPLFVDAAGGDFRLCTGSGTPAAGCSGASPAINLGVDHDDLDGDASTSDAINAGVYVTGSETFGAQSSSSSAPRRLRIRGEH